MIITHYGAEMFKLQSGDLSLVINPISKESKLKPTRYSADIVLITKNLPEFNGKDELSKKDLEPFVIDGPGEYEIKGIFVKGTLSNTKIGGKEGLNTIYTIKMDELNLVFLGPLSDPKPNMDFVEDLDSVDILFVPIGNEDVLSPSEALKLAVSLEAKVIIPMHYIGMGVSSALEDFLKEAGKEDVEILEKLNIKKKDVENKSGEIFVIQSK